MSEIKLNIEVGGVVLESMPFTFRPEAGSAARQYALEVEADRLTYKYAREISKADYQVQFYTTGQVSKGNALPEYELVGSLDKETLLKILTSKVA